VYLLAPTEAGIGGERGGGERLMGVKAAGPTIPQPLTS